MAMGRLSDLKLGMGIVIKMDKDWNGIGRPQVAIAMFSSLNKTLF